MSCGGLFFSDSLTRMADLNGMTKAELLELARERGLVGVSQYTKVELVEALGTTAREEPGEQAFELPAEEPEDSEPAVTREDLERLQSADTEALEAKLPELSGEHRAAAVKELALRERRAEQALKASETLPMFRVLANSAVFHNGFHCAVPAGKLATPAHAEALKAQGVKLEPVKCRQVQDQMGHTMLEVVE